MLVNNLDIFFHRYFIAPFLRDYQRWVLWLPLPLALGISFYFSLAFEPSLEIVLSLAVLMITVTYQLRVKPKAFILATIITMFLLGLATATLRSYYVDTPRIERKMFTNVTGVVKDLDRLDDGGARALIEPTAFGEKKENLPKYIRLKLRAEQFKAVAIGNEIELRAALMPLGEPLMAGAFDFQRYAYFHRIGATGYVIGIPKVIREEANQLLIDFEKERQILSERMKAAITDPDQRAVSIAFVTGERLEISEELWEAIRVAGLAHLLAISGFNVGIAALTAFVLIRALFALFPAFAVKHPIKKYAAIFGMMAAMAYTLFVGAPLPAVRALIMTTIVLLAILLDRDPISVRLAVFTALAILMVTPENLLNASFQLSFAAVIGLIVFYEETRPFWARLYSEKGFIFKIGFYFASCLITTIIATLMTIPFTAYHFQSVPLFGGLIANFIAVPIAAFVIMPLSLLLYILFPFGLGDFCIRIIAFAVSIIIEVVYDIYSHDYFTPIRVVSFDVLALGLITLSLMWLFIWTGIKRFLGCFLGLTLALAVILNTAQPKLLIDGRARSFALFDQQSGQWIMSERMSPFVKETWSERLNISAPQKWRESENIGLYCDSQACIYRNQIAFIYDGRAFARACQEQQIIITALQKPTYAECSSPFIIVDAKDFRREGGISFFWHDDDMRDIYFKSVAQDRGVRPWTSPQVKGQKDYKIE